MAKFLDTTVDELIENFEFLGDDFQESPRPGRTAIVHREITHMSSAVEMDNLAVLAADFDNRSRFGLLASHSGRVADDLGYRGVGRLYSIAHVARGHDSRQIGPLARGLVEQSVEQFFGKLDDVDALVPESRGQNCPRGVQDHNLDRSRTGVYSCVCLQNQLSSLLLYDLD